MFNITSRENKTPATTRDDATQTNRTLPTCPECGARITGVGTVEPGRQELDPCGHTVAADETEAIDRGRGIATDGGRRDGGRYRLFQLGFIGPDGDTDVLKTTYVRDKRNTVGARIPSVASRALGIGDRDGVAIHIHDDRLLLRPHAGGNEPDAVAEASVSKGAIDATLPKAACLALDARPGDQLVYRHIGSAVLVERLDPTAAKPAAHHASQEGQRA